MTVASAPVLALSQVQGAGERVDVLLPNDVGCRAGLRLHHHLHCGPGCQVSTTGTSGRTTERAMVSRHPFCTMRPPPHDYLQLREPLHHFEQRLRSGPHGSPSSREVSDEVPVAMLRRRPRRPYSPPERSLAQRPPSRRLCVPARARHAHAEPAASAPVGGSEEPVHRVELHRGFRIPFEDPITSRTPPDARSATMASSAMRTRAQQRLCVSVPTSAESPLRRSPGHRRYPGAATRDRDSSPWSR